MLCPSPPMELPWYHCIIHHSVLLFQKSMKRLWILWWNLSTFSGHRHHINMPPSRIPDGSWCSNSNDRLLHCSVRWLSKGRVLAGVWAIRNEIKMFLEQQKNHKASLLIFWKMREKKNVMAFLVDVTSHLNDLNLKLQGKNHSVCDLVAAVQSFQRKLAIFKVDLQENFTHFPAMKQI